jgi:hypothetical protein
LLATRESASSIRQALASGDRVYILNGNESNCIQRFGSSGKSILPRSQSDPSGSGCSAAEAGSVNGPDELDVPGSPLEFV